MVGLPQIAWMASHVAELGGDMPLSSDVRVWQPQPWVYMLVPHIAVFYWNKKVFSLPNALLKTKPCCNQQITVCGLYHVLGGKTLKFNKEARLMNGLDKRLPSDKKETLKTLRQRICATPPAPTATGKAPQVLQGSPANHVMVPHKVPSTV